MVAIRLGVVTAPGPHCISLLLLHLSLLGGKKHAAALSLWLLPHGGALDLLGRLVVGELAEVVGVLRRGGEVSCSVCLLVRIVMMGYYACSLLIVWRIRRLNYCVVLTGLGIMTFGSFAVANFPVKLLLLRWLMWKHLSMMRAGPGNRRDRQCQIVVPLMESDRSNRLVAVLTR